jgi:hypothetical protein
MSDVSLPALAAAAVERVAATAIPSGRERQCVSVTVVSTSMSFVPRSVTVGPNWWHDNTS